MAIFRGVGGSGESSDNTFLQEVTAQAQAAEASATAAQASANSILNLTAATGAAGTEVIYNASTGVLTVPRGDKGETDITAANVTGVLTGGTGISIASNGTITNDSPDQTVALTGTGATTVTGTYPSFTINSVNTTYTVGDGGLTTNDFTDADHTKLDGIEASADVTDTANVTAAGALMDSEVTNLAQVKAFDSSDYATAAQGTKADTAHGWGNHATVGYLTSETSHADVVVDGDFASEGLMRRGASAGSYSIVTDNSANWNTAYGWGDHSTQNYATTTGDTFTGDLKLNDSVNLKIGTGDDFTIAHDGTDTTIQNNTGDLIIDVNDSAGQFKLQHEGVEVTRASDAAYNFLMGQALPVLQVLPTSINCRQNITFNSTQTVDGRDVSVDGAKLDTIEANATADQTGAEIKTAYEAEANTNAFTDAEKTKLSSIQERTIRTRFQRRGYTNTIAFYTLTTSYTQLGSSLRIDSGVTTAVENVLDLNINALFNDINSSNEAVFVVTVTAPNPSSEDTINMGTVVASAFGSFTVSGDFTKHFSPYCGLSKNSNGSNAINFSNQQGWEYDPVTDRTTVYVYPYQNNVPTTGDTAYLHPFDWETSGTEINGDEYPIEAYNALGVVHQNQFHNIYLGYYKPSKTFKIKAKESTSSENVQISRVAGTYSQIIGI